MLCPSNYPVEEGRKAKMKFVQKVSPYVYQYRCLHCGCLINMGVEMWDNEELLAHKNNPSLVGGKASYTWRNY